jgi:glycine/D-amino acid oxidase-like deaminating enzyme
MESGRAGVVVIGGGLTGLSAALTLARAGRNVTLLEGKTIGFGGSGRNNGQVIPILSAAEPDRIERDFGDIGTRFVDLLQNSADTLFNLIRDEGIDCEAVQNGWFQPAHSAAHMRLSAARVDAWQKRGAPARLLNRDEATRLIGSNAWHGGMLNPTGGHVNPLMFTRGLADVCAKAGVKIHENSPVTKVSRACRNWLVKTGNAQLHCDAILLATNAYTGALAPALAPKIRRSYVPITSWQMATRPLTATQLETILPNREAISDTRGDLHFFRLNAQNQLVTGSALMFKTNAPNRLRSYIAKRLNRAFPQLGPPEFTHIWGGFVGITIDFFPRFHRLGLNYLGFTGYNGRGLALSVPLGQQLARALMGTTQGDLAIPLTAPREIPFHAIASRVGPAALARYRLKDKRPPRC